MRSRNQRLEDTRATIEASEVDAVGRFGITDAPVVGQRASRTIEGLGAAVVPHAVQRPILENVRTIRQVIVEIAGGADVEDGSAGLGSGNAGPGESVVGLGKSDAPMGAVDPAA